MAYSRTKIANLAFSLLESPPVANIDTDGEPASETLRSVWDAALDLATVDHPWNHAIGRWNGRGPVPAAQNPAPDVFGYAFAKPSDCLQVLQVNPDRNNRGDEFKVEDGLILCDSATINIRGMKRVTEPGRYTVWFVKYFAAYLALLCSKPLNASETIRQSIAKQLAIALDNARAADGREGTLDRIFQSSYLAARFDDEEGY